MAHKVMAQDSETGGTDPKVHALLQWSAKMFIDGKEVDSIDVKMQPFPNDEVTDEALEHNHLKREDLFSVDRVTPSVGYTMITTFLKRHIDKYNRKDKAFWTGYNGRFDSDFTREFFNKNADTYFGSWFWFPVLDISVLAGFFIQKKRIELVDFKQRTVWEFMFPERKDMYKPEEWHEAMFDIDRMLDIVQFCRDEIIKDKIKVKGLQKTIEELEAKIKEIEGEPSTQ